MRPALTALAALLVSAAPLAQPASPPPAATKPATAAPRATAAPAATAAAPASTAAADAPALTPAAERSELQRRFRELYAAGKYQEALPVATRLVSLSESNPEWRRELPTLLVNEGIIELRLGDHPAAEKSFTRSLELVEASQGITSRRLVPPLVGLGRSYAAQGQNGRAAEVLNRALNINRRSDGLFNEEQLPIIDVLVDACVKAGDVTTADKERIYSLQVVEHRYGALDPRTVPTLTKVAQWYEQTRRYAAARALYERKYEVGSKEAGGHNEATVSALIGIARTHRLQFVVDPASLLPDAPTVDPITGRITTSAMEPLAQRSTAVRLNPEGETALVQALKLLDESPKAPPTLRGRTLIEYGDWLMTAGKPDKAMERYKEAWPLFPSTIVTPDVNPLRQVRLLVYRSPDGTGRNLERPRSEILEKSVELAFTVSPRGTVSDVQVVKSEVAESRASRARAAIAESVYAPRFDDGAPVETRDVRFRESWWEVVKPAEEEDKPAAPGDKKPEPASKDEKKGDAGG